MWASHAAGGSHSFAFGMIFAPLQDGLVGGVERRGKHLRNGAFDFEKHAPDGFGGKRAGNFSGRMATHAVGDQGERRGSGVAGRGDVKHHVLVEGANCADVRQHGSVEPEP